MEHTEAGNHRGGDRLFMNRTFQHWEFERRDQEDTEKGPMPILCVLLISVLTLIAPRWIPFRVLRVFRGSYFFFSCLLSPWFSASAVEVPPGFIAETLATNLNAATAIAPVADGRIFIADQTGSCWFGRTAACCRSPRSLCTSPISGSADSSVSRCTRSSRARRKIGRASCRERV